MPNIGLRRFRGIYLIGMFLFLIGCFPVGEGNKLQPSVSVEQKGDKKSIRADCREDIKISDRGNTRHAWLYLTNNGNITVEVTIERSWNYQGERRTDSQVHRLAPSQSKEVFSFPRNQSPSLSILSCSAD